MSDLRQQVQKAVDDLHTLQIKEIWWSAIIPARHFNIHEQDSNCFLAPPGFVIAEMLAQRLEGACHQPCLPDVYTKYFANLMHENAVEAFLCHFDLMGGMRLNMCPMKIRSECIDTKLG